MSDSYTGRIQWVLPLDQFRLVEVSSFRAIFTITRKRQIGDCRMERNRVRVPSVAVCESLRDKAKTLIATAPAAFPLAGQELVFDMAYQLRERGVPSVLGTAPGEQLLSRDEARLTIDAAGKVTGRDTFTHPPRTEPDGGRLCAAERAASFAPLPPDISNRSDRHLVHIFAVYLQRP